MAFSPFSLNNYVKREGRARQTEHPHIVSCQSSRFVQPMQIVIRTWC